MAQSDLSSSRRDAADKPMIVAGIGCRHGTDAAEIIALIEKALATTGRTAAALLALASLDRKAGEPGLLAAAAYFGIPFRTFSADELAGSAAGSARVYALVGTSSVAEAAAARAGRLILSKLKSSRVTCALAMTEGDFELANFGQGFAANVPASTASIAASRSLTSNAGP